MSPKGIAVIVGVTVVILAVVFVPTKPNGVPPPIEDSINLIDDSKITIEPESDSIMIDETVQLDKTTLVSDSGVPFYFDENGTKHYVLSVEDAPTIEE